MRKKKSLVLLSKILYCSTGSLLGDVLGLLLKAALCLTSSWVPSDTTCLKRCGPHLLKTAEKTSLWKLSWVQISRLQQTSNPECQAQWEIIEKVKNNNLVTQKQREKTRGKTHSDGLLDVLPLKAFWEEGPRLLYWVIPGIPSSKWICCLRYTCILNMTLVVSVIYAQASG